MRKLHIFLIALSILFLCAAMAQADLAPPGTWPGILPYSPVSPINPSVNPISPITPILPTNLFPSIFPSISFFPFTPFSPFLLFPLARLRAHIPLFLL